MILNEHESYETQKSDTCLKFAAVKIAVNKYGSGNIDKTPSSLQHIFRHPI